MDSRLIKSSFAALGVTAATLIAASLTAVAADLPARPDYWAPVMVAPPVNQWTGCYVGASVGAAWGGGKIENMTGAGSLTPSNNGFVAGGQIGCDWQEGAWVFGIRNLGDWSNLNKKGGIAGGTFNGFSLGTKNNWVDLLTGRVGYSMGPIWLLYFQVGGAWHNSDVQLFNIDGTQVGEVSKTRTGWTVGVGSEYKFAPNWSVFLEYNYADFGTNPVSIAVSGVGNFSGNVNTNAHMLLTGVNWRF
jgi:outer membrane immunogenic protein